MNLFLAVTDNDWFRFLRSRSPLDEVNFWRPGGSASFRALAPGEPLLFKLHSPEDYVVGGGFFAHFSREIPVSLAWEAFGERNGAASFEEMRRRIEKYRRIAPLPHEDYRIGCILLSQPFFFSESEWIEIPSDWSKNIVQGKGYDTETGEGARLWTEVRLRLQAMSFVPGDEIAESVMFGEPYLVRPRLGQGSFRVLVTDTYSRRCAVTGEKALPALDAAHIRGVADGGTHRLDNGLLLRSDVHRLFDAGYVTVTPTGRFRVSRRLKDDFDNGEPYYPFDDQEIWLPPDPNARPNREFLEWHGDVRFRG
jgi:HNH endonuclease